MKQITIDVLNEIERVCEELATLYDPCFNCSDNNGACFDACQQGKDYEDTKFHIITSIPEDVRQIYDVLEKIGWIGNKIEEKRDILDIIHIKQDQVDRHNTCEELLRKNNFSIIDNEG